MSESNNVSVKVLFAILTGTVLEWYDFSLFASMSSMIAKLFFPASSPLVSLMAAFAVFACGFIMRPLGAILFGHIGDKYGRKKALLLSIWLMALPTLMICLLPDYQMAGLLAPVLLVTCRLLQGLSASGEYPGAMCFLAEIAPANKKGLWASVSMLGVAGGLLLGSVVNMLLLSVMTEAQMLYYGWRLPFILALPLGLLGWFVRYRLKETSDFLQRQSGVTNNKMPLILLLRSDWNNLLKATLMFALSTITFYLSFVYITGYLVSMHTISSSNAMLVNSLSTLVMMLLIPFFGWLSDVYEPKQIMGAGVLLLLALMFPVFHLFMLGGLMSLMQGQLCLVIALAMFVGPMSAMVVQMFPVSVRYSGVALSLNIGGSLFGGTCPLIAAYLVRYTGLESAPAIYPVLLALACLLVIYSPGEKAAYQVESV